ncbi:hypothetical protein [Histophilus somni]|uniref:hypothetical protein n=1 Tax=Histophilus somni TaxID=731 RepID=UPI00094A9F80|nr:hypothetical protein [Histophilus somni]
MKYKLSLVLLAMLPALSHAGGGNFNFYGKAGIDLTSRFETMRIIANHDGNPPISASSRQNTFSPSIFFETTYNILPQTEIGLGLGYIKRKGFEHSASWGIHGGGEYAPISDNTGIETYKIPRYASLPIYFILKQDYALSRNTNLYFKANLGYSINKISNTQYKYYTDLEQENVFKLSEFQSGLRPMKVKNGLYLGLGLGIEYKAFLAEIGYYHTKSKVTRKNYNYEIRNSIYESTSYNNDAIRLTLGVKF